MVTVDISLRRLALSSSLVLLSTSALAQEISESESTSTDQPTSHETDDYNSNNGLIVRLFLNRTNLSLYLTGLQNGTKTRLEYFTATNSIVGVAAKIGSYSGSISRSMPNSSDISRTKGNTRLSDYRLGYMGVNHNIDLYHFSFKGFAYKNRDNTSSTSKNQNGKTNTNPSSTYANGSPFIDDMEARSVGVNYTYVHSPQDFILAGKMTRTLYKESGVSMLANASVAAVNTELSDGIIPLEYKSAFGDSGDVTTLGSFRAYAGPGFGGYINMGDVDLSMAVFLNLGLRLDKTSESSQWKSTIGGSMPSRLGVRLVQETFEVGIFGVFEMESNGDQRDINFGWYQSVIESYVSVFF
ncbi:MAG: hypothetical protein NT027_01100 [Proteobacteria bacterium]|nr:hypothetical protein [Pseudomonadota bacterium]